jgi:hypothetical protein
MSDYLIRLFLVGVFVAVFVWIFLPKPVFVLRIAKGNVWVKKGRLPNGFLNECRLLARENNITKLTIRGFKKRQVVFLKFSGPICDTLQQRFRNVWKQYS